MERRALVWLILPLTMFTFVNSTLIDLEINLDDKPGVEDVCGNVVTLYPGNTSTVSATGRVKNGACGIMYRTIGKDRMKCKEICVTLKSEQLETCDVKIIFSAYAFSRFQRDEIKVFDCRNVDVIRGKWCPDVDQLRVEVVESPSYALQWTESKLYNFKVEISPHFTEEHEVDMDTYLSRKHNQETRDKEYWNRAEGIIVAMCLSSIFLVVMIVMWCYHRHKGAATNTDMAYIDFTGVQVPKKRRFMKNIRSKLNLKSKRRRQSSVGIEPHHENKNDNLSDHSPGMGTLSDFHGSDHASGSAATVDIEQKAKFLESEEI